MCLMQPANRFWASWGDAAISDSAPETESSDPSTFFLAVRLRSAVHKKGARVRLASGSFPEGVNLVRLQDIECKWGHPAMCRGTGVVGMLFAVPCILPRECRRIRYAVASG
jgi:hypothetical protein